MIKKPTTPEKLKTYTLLELEGILHLTRVTLLNYVKTGKLQAIKVGNKWIVTAEALQQFLLQANSK